MYRDDREALQHRLDGVSREAERLRQENEAMREAVGRAPVAVAGSALALPVGAIYTSVNIRSLPLDERARLAAHSVRPFPVWLVGLLNVVTLGLFPLIHFGLVHDRLPKASNNDPSAAKAIGYQFIPYYNLYWIFFSALRLCDRLTLQLRLRSLTARAPRGLMIAACILSLIPYVNLLALFTVWTVAACMLQSTVNQVALLRPTDWDATVDSTTPAQSAIPGALLQPTADQLARQARARTLVNRSHVLGWGGLGMLIFGTTVAGLAVGPVAATVVGVGSAISVVVGAIVGQIGRGMQGRAI